MVSMMDIGVPLKQRMSPLKFSIVMPRIDFNLNQNNDSVSSVQALRSGNPEASRTCAITVQ